MVTKITVLAESQKSFDNTERSHFMKGVLDLKATGEIYVKASQMLVYISQNPHTTAEQLINLHLGNAEHARVTTYTKKKRTYTHSGVVITEED